MSAAGGWPLLLWLSALALSGCVYCPWMAKAGDVAECEGLILDNIDHKAYRLTLTDKGASRTHSATLEIQRADCSVKTPEDLAPMGVERMYIANPRSAEAASFVIVTDLRDEDGEPMSCTSPLVEFDPMDFICPPQAGGRKYLLQPLE